MRRFGLRERIALGFAVVAIAASLALAWALAAYARQSITGLAAANVDAVAQRVARELSSGMDRFAREIELQTLNPVFADPRSTPAQLRAAVEAIRKVYPEFAYVSVVDVASARVIAATGGIFEGGSAVGRPTFEQGRKGLFVGDVHEAVRLAALLPRPPGGEPLRFLDVAAPIPGPDGRPARVLASHLTWSWTAAVRERVLQPVASRGRMQLMLVDSAGAIVLPPQDSVPVGTPLGQLAGSPRAAATGRWADGVEYLAAEAATLATGRFPGLGWRVVVRQPAAVALASADRLRTVFLAGGLLLGLMAAGLGWLLAGRIARPMAELARDAAAFSPGTDLAARAGSGEPSEVATVRAAFRRVAGEGQRRAQALLGELEAIYRGAPLAMCVIDDGARYLRTNPVWNEAFGLGATGAEGIRLADTGAPASLQDAVRAAVETGLPRTVEIELEGAEHRVWQAALAPIADNAGGAGCVSVVAADITEIRRAERSQRQAGERKNQFVSTLAHELRNPLAPVVTALSILDREPSPEQGRRTREMMRKQLQRMIRLIDDLMDVSRLNLGKVAMEVEELSIAEVCEAAVDSVRPQAEARGQRIEASLAPGLPRLRGDKVRLEQVLCNLLSNACRYGREGGLTRLRVEDAGSRLRLVVEDDGRGIAPEFLPHIFELFSQAEAPSHRVEGGLGIGLSLVRNLVELHGGEVRAHSDGPGLGSRFTVELPALPRSAAGATGGSAVASA